MNSDQRFELMDDSNEDSVFSDVKKEPAEDVDGDCNNYFHHSDDDSGHDQIDSNSAYGSSKINRKCSAVKDETASEGTSASGGSLREIRLTTIIDQLKINNRLKGFSSSGKSTPGSDDNGSGGGEQTGPGIGPGGVGPGGRQRSGRRRGPPGPQIHNGAHELSHHNNNNNNNLHGTIKNERLSPQNTTERSSSRSRSVTPSTGSFPGTPPQTGGAGSGDRGASPAHPHSTLLGSHAPPPPPHALARNYSDFMRSLAAKYNNSNSNELFPGARSMVANGFPPAMDSRFALKTPPFPGLLAPPPGVPVPARSPPPPVSNESRERPVSGLFAGYSYAQGGPRTVPAFPSMMDMSSTKALLAIARVANAAKEAEMTSNFIKGASKRPPGSISNDNLPLSSPLDLSSAAGANMFSSSSAKKSRLSPKNESNLQNESASSSGSASCGESGDASPGIDCKSSLSDPSKNDSRNGSFSLTKCEKSQRLNSGRDLSGAASPASFGGKSPASSGRKSPGSTGRKSPSNTSCSACCRGDGRRECGSVPDPEIAAWSVDDVCKFVETIDICAEYSPIFREQRIDGSGLPLLTEDHLTGLLRMKLGPALKMKALLAGRLGNCHCRCQQSSTPTPAPLTSPSPATTPTAASNPIVKVERPPSTDSDNNS